MKSHPAVLAPRGLPSRRLASRGVALIDCLIYIALAAVIMGLAFGAFFRTLDHSTDLERVASATVRALQAGEQWREDIRDARQRPRLAGEAERPELHIATRSAEVAYAFRDGTVLRRAGSTAPWLEVLARVKMSRFAEDPRRQVSAWRWDVELAAPNDNSRFRRILSFQAVPGPMPSP